MSDKTSKPEPAEPTEQNELPQPDPHVQAALDQENELLSQAIQAAQIQHLQNRVVMLNAELRRVTADASSEA